MLCSLARSHRIIVAIFKFFFSSFFSSSFFSSSFVFKFYFSFMEGEGPLSEEAALRALLRSWRLTETSIEALIGESWVFPLYSLNWITFQLPRSYSLKRITFKVVTLITWSHLSKKMETSLKCTVNFHVQSLCIVF